MKNFWNNCGVSYGRLLLAIAASCALAAPLHAGKRGEPIQFSVPKSDIVASNLNELNARKPTVSDLEKKPFQPFSSFNPVAPVAPLPQRPPAIIPSQRARELEDERRNWLYRNPEVVGRPPTDEELFNIPDYARSAAQDKKGSLMEQYYFKRDKKQEENGQKRKQEREGQKEEDQLSSLTSLGTSNPLLQQLNQTETELKGFLGSPDGAINPALAAQPGLFGLRDDRGWNNSPNSFSGNGLKPSTYPGTSDQWLAQKARMDEFKQLINPQAVAPGLNPNSLLPGATPASLPGLPSVTSVTPALPATITPNRSTADFLRPGGDTFNSAFATPSTQDFNERVFGSSAAPPVLNPVEPPRSSPPTSFGDIPRRKF